MNNKLKICLILVILSVISIMTYRYFNKGMSNKFAIENFSSLT